MAAIIYLNMCFHELEYELLPHIRLFSHPVIISCYRILQKNSTVKVWF